MTGLVGNTVVLAQESGQAGLGTLLANILGDPLSIVLVLMGAVLVGVSVLVFGYLTLGAVVDVVTPDLSGEQPPQAR
jgi:hypothetical protein